MFLFCTILDRFNQGKSATRQGARFAVRVYNIHINSRDVIRASEADGWRLKRVTSDHHHFSHPERPGLVTVPHPVKDIKIGTLKSIERQSGVKLRR